MYKRGDKIWGYSKDVYSEDYDQEGFKIVEVVTYDTIENHMVISDLISGFGGLVGDEGDIFFPVGCRLLEILYGVWNES